MVSFRTAGGARQRSTCATGSRLITLAESLGGVESLIELPATMTHASVAGSALEVPDDLVRLSVGIETADDLVADLDQALARLTGRVSRVALVCCVDFGSTFTKAAVVEVSRGELVATGSHPTTIDTDVLDGWDRILGDLAASHGVPWTCPCWPARRPAVGCGSASSATRSW